MEINPRISQLRAEIAVEEAKEAQKAIEGNKKASEQKILDAGLNPEDEAFDSFWDEFDLSTQSGDFSQANKRLDSILEKAESAKLEEPEGDTIDSLAEERVRSIMEERGLLTTDNGFPSAASSDYEDLRDRHNVDPGSLSPSEIAEYHRLYQERRGVWR